MPPRPPACRSAVQHAILRQTQPVWITDDVLADAFHRYLRISNASRKRYGSNVPGPLEAKRRASKRRIMGLATASAGIGPDWGALFGADKPGHQAWTWEAPKSVGQPLRCGKPQPPTLPQWLSNFEQVNGEQQPRAIDPVEEYQSRLVHVRNVSDLETLWSDINVEPQHMALLSQMANTHFLDNLLTEGMGYASLFGFLRNPRLNVPEAKNIKALMEHTKTKGVPAGWLGELINRIRDSLRLGTMVMSELHAIVDSIPAVCAKAFHDRSIQKNWQFGVYWAIWRGLTSCKILPVENVDDAIIRKMVTRILLLNDPPPISDTAKLGKLNITSHTDPALFRLEIYSRLWPVMEDAQPHNFAAHFAGWTRKLAGLDVHDPDQAPDGLGWPALKSVLNSMDADRAREVMATTTSALLPRNQDIPLDENIRKTLRHWFTCISDIRLFRSGRQERLDIFAEDPSLACRIDPILAGPYLRRFPIYTVCRLWMCHWLPQYVEMDGGAARWSRTKRQVRKSVEARRWVPKKILDKAEDQRVDFFFHAIMALKANDLPYDTALSKVVEFILAMYGHATMRKFYTKSTLAGLKFQDPLPFAAAIEAMCETSPVKALKYFKSFPNVWLSLCPKLPLTLIEHGSLPRDELFALLDHHDPANRVPPSSRTTATNSLSPLRVDLIHLIAYAYANQPSQPTRTRFRNVYFCYLYLRDRQAPLQPLLAKALVRAAVTAPLENHEWVSSVKLAWVLRFVRALEGPDVADRLDRLVWQWRGAVTTEARRRWDAAGLNRRRGVSTVTEARQAGLFDADFPRARRAYRKDVVGPGFLAPKCVRRARFGGAGGGGRVWGRLGFEVGGRSGARRPYSPFSATRWRSVGLE